MWTVRTVHRSSKAIRTFVNYGSTPLQVWNRWFVCVCLSFIDCQFLRTETKMFAQDIDIQIKCAPVQYARHDCGVRFCSNFQLANHMKMKRVTQLIAILFEASFVSVSIECYTLTKVSAWIIRVKAFKIRAKSHCNAKPENVIEVTRRSWRKKNRKEIVNKIQIIASQTWNTFLLWH